MLENRVAGLSLVVKLLEDGDEKMPVGEEGEESEDGVVRGRG